MDTCNACGSTSFLRPGQMFCDPCLDVASELRVIGIDIPVASLAHEVDPIITHHLKAVPAKGRMDKPVLLADGTRVLMSRDHTEFAENMAELCSRSGLNSKFWSMG